MTKEPDPTYQTTDRERDPGREGSAPCCAILAKLFTQPAGLTLAALRGLLGYDDRTLRSALIGLSDRRRIRCLGKGTSAAWFTVAHAAAAAAEAEDQQP